MWYDEGGSVAMITASLDADVSAHDGTLREEFPPLHSIVPASRPVTIAACGVLRVGRFVSRHCATLRATGPIVLVSCLPSVDVSVADDRECDALASDARTFGHRGLCVYQSYAVAFSDTHWKVTKYIAN